jgi:hypothetical protein
MRVIKLRLCSLLPGIKIFLDVDDLRAGNMSDLETFVGKSQVVRYIHYTRDVTYVTYEVTSRRLSASRRSSVTYVTHETLHTLHTR